MQSYKAMIFAILLLPVLVNAEEAKASKIEKTFGSFITHPIEDLIYPMNTWLVVSVLLVVAVLLVYIFLLVLYNTGLIGSKEPQPVGDCDEVKPDNRDDDDPCV